jgi:hypothetical protein
MKDKKNYNTLFYQLFLRISSENLGWRDQRIRVEAGTVQPLISFERKKKDNTLTLVSSSVYCYDFLNQIN